jgi:predicted O-methyltransferase YrrM
MKSLIRKILFVLDVLISPLTAASCVLLLLIRRVGLRTMRTSGALFRALGLLPIRDHYFEPLVLRGHLRAPLDRDRVLPGVDLNVDGQLSLLSRFDYGEELRRFPLRPGRDRTYAYHNGNFGPGDSEALYSLIRLYKPRRIVEVGSGYSSLMALEAIDANRREEPSCDAELICIEPFEKPWLEKAGVKVERAMVQDVDREVFDRLEANDILFIDSSHVIRPQGDVLLEMLELVPSLKPGVLVHVHDIFTPRHYPEQWVLRDMRLWNEQYLLEAFLSFNSRFRVLLMLDYLKHHHSDALTSCFPVLSAESGTQPGSFWMIRTDKT